MLRKRVRLRCPSPRAADHPRKRLRDALHGSGEALGGRLRRGPVDPREELGDPHERDAQRYSMRTMRSEMWGKRANTAGSCPGTRRRGSLASERIRSCVRRFDTASSVCAIGMCVSMFS